MRRKFFCFVTVTCLTSSVLLGCSYKYSVQETRLRAEAYYARGNFALAYEELFPLAKRGDPQSQYTIAYMYYYGQGVAKDEDVARSWMRKSAEQGNPRAKYALQLMLENGYAKAYRQPVPTNRYQSSANNITTPTVAVDTNPDINWIRQQNPTEYTLVLSQSANSHRLATLLQKEAITNNRISKYRYLKNGRVEQALTYGTYSSSDAAEFSKKNLDPELSKALKLAQWETIHDVMLP